MIDQYTKLIFRRGLRRKEKEAKEEKGIKPYRLECCISLQPIGEHLRAFVSKVV
jgi:hypothetical protein